MSIGLDEFVPLMSVIIAKRFIQDEKDHFFREHLGAAESRVTRRKRDLMHQARRTFFAFKTKIKTFHIISNDLITQQIWNYKNNVSPG